MLPSLMVLVKYTCWGECTVFICLIKHLVYPDASSLSMTSFSFSGNPARNPPDFQSECLWQFLIPCLNNFSFISIQSQSLPLCCLFVYSKYSALSIENHFNFPSLILCVSIRELMFVVWTHLIFWVYKMSHLPLCISCLIARIGHIFKVSSSLPWKIILENTVWFLSRLAILEWYIFQVLWANRA
jgi:hypothetical protein